MAHTGQTTLRTGQLAYYDSFAGLIPCRVLTITGRPGIASTAQNVTVRLTGARGAYRRGETIHTTGIHAVPRGAVRQVQGNARIRPYKVEVQ